jgi:uncharacterized protein with HEPN domain
MNERDLVLLKDMLDAANKVESYIKGKTRIDLEKDEELIGFAVIRALAIIGEAGNRISEETHLAHPEIEWQPIVAMRNRIIHGYDTINYDIVWETAKVSVPKLITELEKILSDIS